MKIIDHKSKQYKQIPKKKHQNLTLRTRNHRQPFYRLNKKVPFLFCRLNKKVPILFCRLNKKAYFYLPLPLNESHLFYNQLLSI